MKYTKLILKKFGKIKKAEIELSPFLLFIGDNNSGKSYLMTLIYGLIKYYDEIEKILFENENFILNCDIYKEIAPIIEKNIKANRNNDNKIFLTTKELELFNNLLNVLLNKNKEEIINYIFNSNNEINLYDIALDLNIDRLKIQIKNKNEIFYKYNYFKSKPIISGVNIAPQSNNLNFCKEIIRIIFEKCIEYTKGNSINRSVFLPTSRTGFLLTHKELSKKSIREKYGKNNNNKITILQNPIMDFIDNLIDLSFHKLNERKEYNEIFNIFKNNILNGDIKINKETDSIHYEPTNNKDLQFLMYLSSAVITEVTPLFLFLKYDTLYNTFFIEEPEMSLHLKLQKEIARILINLVNINKHIIISTHSDTILEHINNMVKLKGIKDKEKRNSLIKNYSYTKNDFLDVGKVRIYQFDTDESDSTDIIELKGDESTGFYISTFHNYIDKASDEYYNIYNEIAD